MEVAAPHTFASPAVCPAQLGFNESPFDWPLWLKERVLARLAMLPWNRYPTGGRELEAQLARHLGVEPEGVLLGAGSFALLDLVVRVRGTQRGSAVLPEPGFDACRASCLQAGVKPVGWALDDDFQYAWEQLPEGLSGGLVIAASPNNPTGTVLPHSLLRRLLETYPDTTVVLDEAYFEFDGETALPWVHEHANLLVVRTFSKALSAAGVRCGYVVGQPSSVAPLRAAATPFSVSMFAAALAAQYLGDPEARSHLERLRLTVVQERDRLFGLLRHLGESACFRVVPSRANFFLVDFGSPTRAQAFARALGALGVRVRAFEEGRAASCLRLTVGRGSENARLLSALQTVVSCEG